MLSVVTFIQHFKQYSLGRKFVISTDHNALRWIMSFKVPENQMATWIKILSQYDFSILHRPGAKHGNADFLSRACETTSCDCYDGHTILSDLPCFGCTDCLKKHEQWSSFMLVDDVIPIRINRMATIARERSESDRSKDFSWPHHISCFLIWIISLLLLTLYRFTSVRISKFLHVGRKCPEAHVRACSVKSKENNAGSSGQGLALRLPSYIKGYTSADLAKLLKNDPEVGTGIKWMESNSERTPRDQVTSESPFTRYLWLLWD